MPRYFFHIKRGQVTVLDQDGVDLINSAQAEEEAARRAQEIVAREGATAAKDRAIVVADENWQTLFEFLF